jgi:hypothetical protein
LVYSFFSSVVSQIDDIAVADKKLLYGVQLTVISLLKSLRSEMIEQTPSLTLLLKYITPQHLFTLIDKLHTIFQYNTRIISSNLTLLEIMLFIYQGAAAASSMEEDNNKTSLGMKEYQSAKSLFSLDFFLTLIKKKQETVDVFTLVDNEWILNASMCLKHLKIEVSSCFFVWWSVFIVFVSSVVFV